MAGGDSIFRFVLQPLDEVVPEDMPEGRFLSWEGLSSGWYWLALGDQEVLRLRAPDDPDAPPYVDGAVVRLWEDVLALLPEVLEPVPADVARALRDVDAWERSIRRSLTPRDRPRSERVYDAASWWRERELDLAHLVHPPRVHFWRKGDVMHIRWVPPREDTGVWEPVSGELTLDVTSFLEEVRLFTADFLGQMGERVQELVDAGGMPGVKVDLQALQREQRARQRWLLAAQRKAAQREPTDWAMVRKLLRDLPLP